MTTLAPVVFLAASRVPRFGDAGEAGVAHDGAGHLGLVGGAVELVLGAAVQARDLAGEITRGEVVVNGPPPGAPS